MRFARFGFLLLALVTLSGCEDFSSAKNTLGTFATAILKQNFRLYEKSLSGAALEQFGTADSMRVWAKEFDPKQWGMTEPLLVAVRKGDNGWDVQRDYAVALKLRERIWWHGTVVCQVQYINRMRDPDRNCSGGNSGSWGECHYSPVEDCRISEIFTVTN